MNPAEVLRDPLKAIPDPRSTLNSPDKAYAMTTGLGETAAAWRKGNDAKLRKECVFMFMRAVGHVTSRDREYIATAINTFVSNGGDIQSLITTAKNHKDDPLIKAVVDFLVATFNKQPK
ncbi:MAG: hypothetical protein EBU84_08275 [Actinobacteria bacterium]|nr:hypothetical protein [Actinomycetota bacterium]